MTGDGSTAPPHQEATRTTAGPHNSGAPGKPTTPTHKYKQNAGITIIIFKTARVDFTPVPLVWRGRF